LVNYKEFLQWIDVEQFATACNNISNSQGAKVLNEHSNRMLKEKFILGALRLANHKKNIQWVDTIDYDLTFDSWHGATIEVKTGDGPMFTTKQGLLKENIEVKLKNIYESKENTRTTLDKTFDHLMIIQNSGTFAIGFVPYSVASEHLVQLTDGWKARIPSDKVNIIYTKDMRDEPVNWDFNLDPKEWVLDTLSKVCYK